MSPRSLLFSSDEETSRALSQALQELEFEVECCPEIFAAVERLTSQSFQIIVVDWDEGLEASFLLKTARELKSSAGAFGVAIASHADAANTARKIGADLVISKPVAAQSAKYAMLTCDSFLAHMKVWLPEMLAPKAAAPTTPLVEMPKPRPNKAGSNSAASAAAIKPISPVARAAAQSVPKRLAQVHLPMASSLAPYLQSTPIKRVKQKRGTVLLSAAVFASALSVTYSFSQPMHAEAAVSSVTKICERALERTRGWLQAPPEDNPPAAEMAQSTEPKPVRNRPSSHVKVTPVPDYSEPSPTPQAVPPAQSTPVAKLEPQQVAAAAPPRIPDSLRTPVQSSAIRNVAARITPSLLQSLEPVNLPEELAQQLLLEKVSPSYPEKALRAGMHGPVVLEAWIGRDGRIEDLKLVRGSFLLGQAAYEAVRQWRYKPYVRNGQAVEAQTYVTIDFKLP